MKITFVRAQVRSRTPGADTYLYVSKRGKERGGGERERKRERERAGSFGIDDCPTLATWPSPFDSRVESPRSERGRKRKKEDKEKERDCHTRRQISPPLASSRLHRSTQSRIITRAHRLVSSRSARRYAREKERVERAKEERDAAVAAAVGSRGQEEGERAREETKDERERGRYSHTRELKRGKLLHASKSRRTGPLLRSGFETEREDKDAENVRARVSSYYVEIARSILRQGSIGISCLLIIARTGRIDEFFSAIVNRDRESRNLSSIIIHLSMVNQLLARSFSLNI